jgi:hypothetical protein
MMMVIIIIIILLSLPLLGGTYQLTPGCDGRSAKNEWRYFSTPRHMPSRLVL